jgi:hypothetical protein
MKCRRVKVTFLDNSTIPFEKVYDIHHTGAFLELVTAYEKHFIAIHAIKRWNYINVEDVKGEDL